MRGLSPSLATLVPLLLLAPTAGAQDGPPRSRAPAPAPGTLFLYPERFPIGNGTLGEGERGMLFVPVNRADTARGVIGVEVWRFRAQRATNRPPIFQLHGGPGFGGLEPDSAFYHRAVRLFTAHGDYVVVGQRGIGTSKPNTICENVRGGPFTYSQRCRAWWEEAGLDLSGLTVVEAAADVADAARALGYDSIVVFGTSFGSHWGMAVLRYHPDVVARAVLSGMEGPNHTYDSPTGVWKALRRVAAAADTAQVLREHVPEGGIIAGLERARRQLEAGPVRVTVQHPETGEDEQVIFTVFSFPGLADGYSASPSSRSGLVSWPADAIRLARGDYAGVARARLERAAASSGDGESFRTASFFMLDCSSGVTAERLEQLKADPAIRMVGDRTSFYQAACPPWNADLGDAFRANFDTDIPTAIVHGTWDVNTPYENAQELAPHFHRGKLVTVVGGSHGALSEAILADTAFAARLWRFVQTGNTAVLPDSVILPPMDWVVPRARTAPPARR